MNPGDRPLDAWRLPDGTVTFLGNHVPSQRTLRIMRALPDIPDSELREFDLRTSKHFTIKVKNQSNTGSCNGHAAATSLEIANFFAGAQYTPLSPFFIYAILCNGYDQGSIIADALKLLKETGTCPELLVPHGTINPRKLSTEAKAAAKRFRIEIGYEINSHRDLVVATHLRLPSNFSLPVNSGFDNLDADGVPGNRAGIHNHAVCGGLGLKKTQKHGWVVLAQNSWGTNWGDKGFFWAAEKTVAGLYPDAYCVSAIEYDPTDNLPPILA
jgi:hypothetical protein